MDNTSNTTNTTNNPIPTEDTPMTQEQLILSLFQLHLDNGGDPKITQFRTHLNTLLATHIKPLTGGSGSRASGSTGGKQWRDDLKNRFGGRGKKWVYTTIESVTPYLDEFDSRGVDTTEYRAWITQFGRAWVRYTGPRINKGQQCAAFEIRTKGSTIDQPKELFYLPISELDELELLKGPPYSYQLEFEVTPEPEVDEIEESINDDLDDDDLEADDDDM